MTGSVIVHWQPKQVKNTLIPRINQAEQDRLGNCVREANMLRKGAKRLFSDAFQLIEAGIEEKALN